jgi:hypothetical protein
MPELIEQPSRVTAAGQPPKLIDEYVGRVNTGQDGLSIAVCLPAFAPDTVHRDD